MAGRDNDDLAAGAGRYVYFEGFAHPAGRDETEYNGHHFTKQEIERHTELILNKPVWHLHGEEGEIAIGKVTKAWEDESGRFTVRGFVDRCAPGGPAVVQKLRSGELKDLSLGTRDFKLSTPKTIRIVAKHINHLGLVPKGDREGTQITFVQEDSDRWKLSRETLSFISRSKKLESQLSEHFQSKELQTLIEVMSSQEPAQPQPQTQSQPQGQAQQQPPTEHDAGNDGDMTAEEMAQQLAAERARYAQIEHMLSTIPGLMEAAKDPAGFKRDLERVNAQKEADQRDWTDKVERARQKMVAEYEQKGATPPDRLVHILDPSSDVDPALQQDIVTYIESVAGAASANRASDNEALLEKERKARQETEAKLQKAQDDMKNLQRQFTSSARMSNWRDQAASEDERARKRHRPDDDSAHGYSWQDSSRGASQPANSGSASAQSQSGHGQPAHGVALPSAASAVVGNAFQPQFRYGGQKSGDTLFNLLNTLQNTGGFAQTFEYDQ